MTALAQPICLRRPLLRPLCLRATVARLVMESVARGVPVDILMPDGSLLGRGDATTSTGDRPVLRSCAAGTVRAARAPSQGRHRRGVRGRRLARR